MSTIKLGERFWYNHTLLKREDFWMLLHNNIHAFETEKPGLIQYYDNQKKILPPENSAWFYDKLNKVNPGMALIWKLSSLSERRAFLDDWENTDIEKKKKEI